MSTSITVTILRASLKSCDGVRHCKLPYKCSLIESLQQKGYALFYVGGNRGPEKWITYPGSTASKQLALYSAAVRSCRTVFVASLCQLLLSTGNVTHGWACGCALPLSGSMSAFSCISSQSLFCAYQDLHSMYSSLFLLFKFSIIMWAHFYIVKYFKYINI